MQYKRPFIVQLTAFRKLGLYLTVLTCDNSNYPQLLPAILISTILNVYLYGPLYLPIAENIPAGSAGFIEPSDAFMMTSTLCDSFINESAIFSCPPSAMLAMNRIRIGLSCETTIEPLDAGRLDSITMF